MPILAILLIVPLVVVVYFVATYNKLQTIKTRIKASIQEIGNQLKRQAELIPNLAESVKGYLKHEKDIFKQLTEARKSVETASNSGDTDKILKSQDLLQKTIGSLKVLIESNPEIKGSQVVENLMAELRDTADKVMYSRRTLIDLSADYNQVLVVFPSNLVAKTLGFKPEKGLSTPDSGAHLEVSSEETKAPKINL
ncbi:MAG: LemA family protein [Patescibacteria group bacterium]